MFKFLSLSIQVLFYSDHNLESTSDTQLSFSLGKLMENRPL